MNKIKNIFRYLVMKKLTGNLGRVVEEDDKIICYVKKINSDKEYYTHYFYCRGIDDSNKDLANFYDLNKPITYIFNDIEFKRNDVVIFGYNGANIIINNCNFIRGLIIKNPTGKTILDNTIFKPFLNLSLSSSELIFRNMNIKNPMNLMKLDISLYGDNIRIINSKIGETFEKTNVNIDATNKLNIVNSKISGKIVELKSNQLISDDSLIFATEIIVIDANKSNKLNVKAPSILTNDDFLLNQEENSKESKEVFDKNKQRRELLKVLKTIKEQCEIINNSKVEEYKNDLNKEEISKILRK